jgi:hypothetical protein
VAPLYAVSGRDGEPPSWRAIGSPQEARAHETVLDALPPDGCVWDEGLKACREKTAAERVRGFKREKKAALSGEAKALTAQRFAIGFADEEFQALTAARALGQAADPRLVEAVQLAQRVRAAYAKVDAIADDDPEAERKVGEVTL